MRYLVGGTLYPEWDLRAVEKRTASVVTDILPIPDARDHMWLMTGSIGSASTTHQSGLYERPGETPFSPYRSSKRAVAARTPGAGVHRDG
jgi:hypothetical protein